MKQEESHKIFSPQIPAFLLGLFSANNIVYCFVLGNTPIMLINVFALICFVGLLIINPGRIINSIHYITYDLRLVFLYISSSIIVLWAVKSDNLTVGLNGYLNLILSVLVFWVTLAFSNFLDIIIKGIFVGIIVNLLFVAFEMISYQRRMPFSLSELFPEWQSFAVMDFEKGYRPMGLFRESGHLIRFLAVYFLLCWEMIKKTQGKFKTVFLISISLVFMISRSSSFALFVLVLFTIETIKKKNFAISIMAVIIMLILWMVGGALFDSAIAGLTDFSLDDKGNATRLDAMSNAIDIIKNSSIFGNGWNTTSKLLSVNDYLTLNIHGTYSVAIQLACEIGIGCLLYYYFLLKSTYKLLEHDNSFSVAVGGSLLMYLLLFCSTDYNFCGEVAVLHGICLITLYRNKVHDQEELASNTMPQTENNRLLPTITQ